MNIELALMLAMYMLIQGDIVFADDVGETMEVTQRFNQRLNRSIQVLNRSQQNVNDSNVKPLKPLKMKSKCGLAPYPGLIYRIIKLVLVIGIVANAVVVARVILDDKLRSPTFVAIACLAFSDFMFITMNLIQNSAQIVRLLNCNMNKSFFDSPEWINSIGVSWFGASAHVTLMAVIRFIIVVYPLKTPLWLSPRRVIVFSVSIWILGCIIFGILDILARLEKLNTKASAFMLIGIWAVVFIAPVITTATLHTIKLHFARKSASHTSSSAVKKSVARMSKTIIIVIVLSVTFPAPRLVLKILSSFNIKCSTNNCNVHLANVSLILFLLNNCINPFVYAFMSPLFRKSLKRMCDIRVQQSHSNEDHIELTVVSSESDRQDSVDIAAIDQVNDKRTQEN